MLGILGLGKYGGSGEHLFDQSHCYENFSGLFLPVGSKITEMTHWERNARLVMRIGSKYIEVLGMEGGKYGGGADNYGSKMGVISTNCQMILPGTTLEHLTQMKILPGVSTQTLKLVAALRAVFTIGLTTMA